MTNTNLTIGGENATESRNKSTAIDKRLKVSTISMTDSEVLLDADGVAVRSVHTDDGALLWQLARDSGGVELNSPYAYMLMSRNFSATSAVAEVFGCPAGFVMAHRLPARPHVLFVWQIAVLPEFRGLGIAKRLLEGLVDQPACLGVRKLEATVTPSNKASAALFERFTKDRDAQLDISTGFAKDDFPMDERHEEERLFTIHPIHPID